MNSRWPLLLIAVLAVVCVGLAQTPQGHAKLAAAGLFEQPASYTELAFTTPDAMPETLATPTANVKVSFGIHNVSGSPHSYDWSVAVVRSGVSKVKATGTALAAAQGTASVTKSVATDCTSGRVEVVVRLASPAQSISFWMTCPGTSAKATPAKTKAAR